MVDYVFDGSFGGLLTAVFESFERKHPKVRLLLQGQTPIVFGEIFEIFPTPEKAGRVWKGLQKKAGDIGHKNYYKAFLSEDPVIYQHLFDYALYIFNHGEGHYMIYGEEHVMASSAMARKGDREKHRMGAFVRFQAGSVGMFFAFVAPDVNVLTLIIRHFKNRYAGQHWM